MKIYHSLQSHPRPSVSLAYPSGSIAKIRLNGCAWMLFYQCLVLALPLLKLLGTPGVEHWSWLWVLAPLWVPSALLLLVTVSEWLSPLFTFGSRK